MMVGNTKSAITGAKSTTCSVRNGGGERIWSRSRAFDQIDRECEVGNKEIGSLRISPQAPLMPRFKTKDIGSWETSLAATFPLGPMARPSMMNDGSSLMN